MMDGGSRGQRRRITTTTTTTTTIATTRRRRNMIPRARATALRRLLLVAFVVSVRKKDAAVPVVVVVAAGAAGEGAAVLRCPSAAAGGFGRRGNGDDGEWVAVPPERVDDGYCDCPATGADEPGTGACAGSEHWSGVVPIYDAEEENEGGGGGGEGEEEEQQQRPSPPSPQIQPLWFQCPQQPKLRLSLSKLNDGICDCCDGADEASASSSSSSSCEDICGELLAEERAQLERIRTSYRIGAKKRQEQIEAFAKLRVQVEHDVQIKQEELNAVNRNMMEKEDQIETSKLKHYLSRYDRASDRSLALASVPTGVEEIDERSLGLKGMLEALSTEEIAWFVVHACQTSGEMDGARPGKTCVPLRLAGLDAGIVWKPETYEAEKPLVKGDLANLLYHNVNNENKIWDVAMMSANNNKNKNNNRPGRRRLSAEDTDDEDYEYDHDDYVDAYERDMSDDDYPIDDPDDADEEDEEYDRIEQERLRRERNRHRLHGSSNNDGGTPDEDDDDGGDNADDAGSKREELAGMIKGRAFYSTRSTLLDQSNVLLQRVEEATAINEEEERKKNDAARKREEEQQQQQQQQQAEGSTEEGGGEEEEEKPSSEESTEEEESSGPRFDPVALARVRGKLEALEKAVKRGVDYAVSAKVLLDAVQSYAYENEQLLREDLYRLAVGTINHGKLSSLHVWQVFQAVIPDLSSVGAGDSVSSDETCKSPWAPFCPPKTVDRTVGMLEVKVPPEAILKAGEIFCEKQYEESSVEAACAANMLQDGAIPTDINDGFMGYYEVRPREEDDPLHDFLRPLSLEYDEESKAELDKLIDEKYALKNQKEDIERAIKGLKDSVGGDDPDMYGPDGELHSIRDECFEVDTGKYTYELCMFKSAAQKDTGSKGHGTDLGKWTNPEVNAGNGGGRGGRVWKWERGAKCWNGPQRSATAYVTCGEETRVLSAEEPEICKYVMRVQSPLACDEAYAREHGL